MNLQNFADSFRSLQNAVAEGETGVRQEKRVAVIEVADHGQMISHCFQARRTVGANVADRHVAGCEDDVGDHRNPFVRTRAVKHAALKEPA